MARLGQKDRVKRVKIDWRSGGLVDRVPVLMVPRRSTQGDPDWMQTVLARCAEAVAAGEAPFAAAIVRDGELLAVEHNLVHATLDPTAHAELLAIRSACEKLGTPELTDCTLYCSCEPCPMCFAAAHFAHISRVVYGATIGDAALAGYGQLPIFASQIKILGRSPIEIVPELLREECVSVLRAQPAR